MSRRCCDGGKTTHRVGWRGSRISASILPAAVLVFLPKCPMCLAAWLTVGTGVAVPASGAAWLRPMLVVLWLAALALVIRRLNWLKWLLQKGRNDNPFLVKRHSLIKALMDHNDPSIRLKIMVHVLGEDPQARRVQEVQNEIRSSPRVLALLPHRDRDGRFQSGIGVYAKWQGPHWVLATLADIGYPAGDASLNPVGNQIVDYWLQDRFYKEFAAKSKGDAYKNDGVPIMQGRYSRCASQQGNALYDLIRLGLANERNERLVERLLHWQWPDGGWNCDKDPGADTSSFMETLLPVCGLAVHARQTGSQRSRDAALRAAEVLLSRRLFKRRSDGTVIHSEFIRLHYPLYWHYDFLGGLKAMAEAGLLHDRRCDDALDLLEAKELPDGGWPAERRYYKVAGEIKLSADYVDWGGTGKNRMNEWVTADALAVLHASGRIGSTGGSAPL